MYMVMPVQCWILFLLCWHTAQGKATISTTNRTCVALAGETLSFTLHVTVPANFTGQLQCFLEQQSRSIWSKELKSTDTFSTDVTADIIMYSSGNYFCRFGHDEVHWVVLVRATGYEDPPGITWAGMNVTDLITLPTLLGVLLILNVVGSVYSFRCYKKYFPDKNKENVVVGSKLESNAVTVDEDASHSLYTSLQHRTNSVYDILTPETQEIQPGRKLLKKNSNAEEVDILSSVYENF